jgi:hypothetical protein
LSEPYACGDCGMANRGENLRCEYCGSADKTPLFPVRETNQHQNTPSSNDLEARMAADEASRTA